jgi:hypothetical protein
MILQLGSRSHDAHYAVSNSLTVEIEKAVTQSGKMNRRRPAASEPEARNFTLDN